MIRLIRRLVLLLVDPGGPPDPLARMSLRQMADLPSYHPHD